MFVSVMIDSGSEDSQRVISNLLLRYGFTQVQKGCYESLAVADKTLARLKLDIDRAADFYDAIRIYQFPMEGTMAITSLNEKRWRRKIIKETQE